VSGSVSFGQLTTPKSGKVRSVPMIADVGKALADLSLRKRFTGDDDPVFPAEAGGYLDGSALRRRYKRARKAAESRELRFHDLRHSFGSLAIDKASIVQVQHWMGHADVARRCATSTTAAAPMRRSSLRMPSRCKRTCKHPGCRRRQACSVSLHRSRAKPPQ
jgi:integrase